MKKRHGALLLAATLLCGLLVGCAAKSMSMDSSADDNFSPQASGGSQTEMSENSMDFDASPDMPAEEPGALELPAGRAGAGELERKIKIGTAACRERV